MNLSVLRSHVELRMSKCFGVACGLAGIVLPIGCLAAPPKPAAVLQKMFDLYKNAHSLAITARTYQKSLSAQQKVATFTVVREIKATLPNRFYEHSTISGSLMPHNTNVVRIICSDGKLTTLYDSVQNVYMQQPAGPQVPPAFVFLRSIDPLLMSVDLKTARITKTLQYHGQNAYVIQVSLALRPGVSAAVRAKVKPLELTVSQGSYRLMRVVDANQLNPTILGLDTEILDQQIGANIPESVFRFVPPKGARLLKPPAPAAGGVPSSPSKPNP